MKEKPREEAHFDRARAVEEMKRYLDVCVRGMGLELEYEISSGDASAGARVTAVRRLGTWWWRFAARMKRCCLSTTPSCYWRLSTWDIDGCGSIRGCTITCDSIAGIIERRGSRN